MPTYEYVCSKCDHRFDLFQPITDKPLTVCPKELCAQRRWGKGPVKRAIGAGAGLIFKGSGFYITDYRSEGYKESAKKESAAAGASSTGGETKPAGGTEPKPSAKSETQSTTRPESKTVKPKADRK